MAAQNNMQMAEVKDSFMKMATSALTSSKTAWTRARQFTEERLGNAEKTQYEAQFENLWDRAEKTKQWSEKMLRQTEAMLQPNPGVRLEEYAFEKLDKKTPLRPTNAFVLGQTMCDAGREFGPGTAYGNTLTRVGGSMKKIGNAEKDFMQKSMSQYIHPMRSSLENEMKTLSKEKRALETARLDLDACKNKVRKAQSPDRVKQAESELRVAQAEFDRQYEITKLLLDGIATTHANHLRHLRSFVEALGMYYAQCQQYTAELQKELQNPLDGNIPSAPSRPPPPSNAPQLQLQTNQTVNLEAAGRPAFTRRAKVLYDYDATDKSELSLLADEIITVHSPEGMDSDWMIGERGSQRGRVPLTYLELL